LPGVKELFEAQNKPKEQKEVKEEIRRWVDAAYYGYGDEGDEEELEKYERKMEEEARQKVLGQGGEIREGWSEIPSGWKVPSREEVSEFLLERRRQKLLAKLG